MSNLYVSDCICDHRALHISLLCNRFYPKRKQIEVRPLNRIKCDVLEADLICVNIDRKCTDVTLLSVNMMLHFHLYWINMHHHTVNCCISSLYI